MIADEIETVRHPGGRPPHAPTVEQREQVEMLSGYGLTHIEIAAFVGIAKQTLENHYSTELELGRVRADAKVAGALFKKAISDEHPQATTAAIWWEKTRAGRKEPKQEHAHSGAVGTYDASKLGELSDDQLKAFYAILSVLAPGAAADGGGPSGDGEA